MPTLWVSSNTLYFVPTKQIELPEPDIKYRLTKAVDGHNFALTSPVLTKSVLIGFGDLTTETSDNYVDLLPGETVEIHIKTTASDDQLKSALKFSSLADAFGPSIG